LHQARGVVEPREPACTRLGADPPQVRDGRGRTAVHVHRDGLLNLQGFVFGQRDGCLEVVDLVRRRFNVSVNAVEVEVEVEVDVDDRIEVGTPKSHRRRSVPFPALLTVPLSQRVEGRLPEDLVFWGQHGTHKRRSHNEHGWFPAAVTRAGLPPLTPYSLRHTAESLP